MKVVRIYNYTYMHTLIYINKYIHTYIHTHMYTYKLLGRKRSHTCMYVQVCMCVKEFIE